VGEVVVADIHAVPAQLLEGFLYVDGIPMHNGVEGQANLDFSNVSSASGRRIR
jgi:hypothetical protein